jgi:hypothetical protein
LVVATRQIYDVVSVNIHNDGKRRDLDRAILDNAPGHIRPPQPMPVKTSELNPKSCPAQAARDAITVNKGIDLLIPSSVSRVWLLSGCT